MFNVNIPQNPTKVYKLKPTLVFSKNASAILQRHLTLFFKHLLFFNLLLKKKRIKKIKLSKKLKYKKIGTHVLQPLTLSKNSINLFNYKQLKLNPPFFFKKTKTFRQIYIFNIPKIPFRKKTIGMRMGKGIGAIKTWALKLPQGWPLFIFFNWNYISLLYLIAKLSKLLPFPLLLNKSQQINFLDFLCYTDQKKHIKI